MGFMRKNKAATGKAVVPSDAPASGHPAKAKTGGGGYLQILTGGTKSHPAEFNSNPDHGMRYGTEFIGTFFLLLVGLRVGTFTASMALAALTFMGARISKAHFNPAITIAHVVRGGTDLVDAAWYIVWQTGGAATAVIVSSAFFGTAPASAASGSLVDNATTAAGLAVPTFVYALIHVAMLAGSSRTEFYGLAVGFALFSTVTAYGSGANLFNPAVGLGTWVANGLLGKGFALSALIAQAVYLVGQGAAGALAALLFSACDKGGLTGELLTEAIGTFIVTILVISTADSGVMAMAQAVGLGYAALTFFGAEMSEAHFNPAVTVAHLIHGKHTISNDEGIKYVGVQLVAAAAAGCLGVWYTDLNESILSGDATDLKFMVALLFGATLLCLVHLHVISAQNNNGFFGLAIGFTLLADKVMFHTLFNPAAALGIFVGVGVFGSGFGGVLDLAVLLIVPFIGAGLAAMLFKVMRPGQGNGAYITEAVGIACIVLTLFSTYSDDHGDGESFGGAALDTPPAATAVRRSLIWGAAKMPTSSSGLNDGLLYAALAYMGQYISNAHFNPAISLAHGVGNALRGGSWGDWKYPAVQIGAAVVFGCGAGWLHDVPDLKSSIDVKFMVGLVLFTFLLCIVHLNTALSLEDGGNGFFGLAIGFAMFAGILSFGDTETALFNPAIAIGIKIAGLLVGGGGLDGLVDLALLVVLPLVGAALAGVVFNIQCGSQGAVVTEAVGTFLIVLTLLEASGSVGLLTCAVTYMAGAISGAHFNPAISFTHYFNGDLAQNKFYTYVAAQSLAAFAAGAVGLYEGSDITPSTAAGATPLLIMSAEALFTFLICLVHLNVLSANGVEDGKNGNGYFGLAMGFTVLAGFITVGGVSGGIFNPATGIGLYLANAITNGFSSATSVVLYYLVAPLLGARVAALAYAYQKAGNALSA